MGDRPAAQGLGPGQRVDRQPLVVGAALLAERDRILAELVSVKNYAMGAVNVANRAIDARDDFNAENDAFNIGGTLKARPHP